MKKLRYLGLITLSLACLTAVNSKGDESLKANPHKATLSAVTAAELPAKAAQLVTEAKASEKKSTTVDVVTAALELNPAAAPAIVGAIARAVPEMASLAASTAATLQPKQTAAISKAAVAAAPSQLSKIVFAVCKELPTQYRDVAVAVAQASPGSGKEILEAVGSAIPSLKPSLEQAVAHLAGGAPSVAAVIDAASKSALDSSATQTAPIALNTSRGPSVGPPYIPLSGTPTNVTPATGGEVPPGGRNYAAP